MQLSEYPLKDIYLEEHESFFSGVPGTKDPIPAPEEFKDDLLKIRQICIDSHSKTTKEEFSIRYGEVAYRVALLESLEEKVFVLRRMPKTPPMLNETGIHDHYIDLLMTPGLSGLIIVAGAYGQGKTTTASAIIGSRLTKLGGVCITIEDPPEMPLQGRHGEGKCYQRWVEQGGFAEACRKSARWAPSIIFLGEVRDQETALEALKASINGRLVICTTHASSVSAAIERIYSLASGQNSGSEDYASLLANGLACVMHQELVNEPKAPKLEFLWFGKSEDTQSAGLRTHIRNRKWEQVGNEITFQQNKLFMSSRQSN